MAGMQEMIPAHKEILPVIDSLKIQVAADRSSYIKVSSRPQLTLV